MLYRHKSSFKRLAKSKRNKNLWTVVLLEMR